jgi:hypothetical protein
MALVQTGLRMPEELRDRVKALADRDFRSLNDEFLYLVSLACEVEEVQSKLEQTIENARSTAAELIEQTVKVNALVARLRGATGK